MDRPAQRSFATRLPAGRSFDSSAMRGELQARLRILLTVAFGSFAAVGILAGLAPWISPPATSVTLGLQILALVVCVLSGALLADLARARSKTHIRMVGHAFAVLVSIAMAVAEVALSPELGHGRWGVSGIGIWIVLVPLLYPATPRATMWVATACASAVPLTYVGGLCLGLSRQPAAQLFAWIFPLYFCAGLAVVAATSLHRYREALRVAQRELHELGQYKLIRLLGQGGMGEVWLARHLLLLRSAAIKFISMPDEADLEQRARLTAHFEAEASAIARLSSVHTVTLYDYGVSEQGDWYYVMELLDGIDLQAVVDRDGYLPDWRVARILAQACRSLSEAHSHGLIHRDIKPGNLMLCRLGDEVDMVKVVDFGLVGLGKTATSDDDPGRRSNWVGSSGYVAPEILLGTEPCDARVDIYALGCVGWYLLTGTTVFPQAANVKDECVLHCTQPPPARLARSEHDIGLVDLIYDALAKNPTKRPATATAMRLRLESLECWHRYDEKTVATWWESIPVPKGE